MGRVVGKVYPMEAAEPEAQRAAGGNGTCPETTGSQSGKPHRACPPPASMRKRRAESVSLEKLKRRLNVTDTDRDALLGDLLEDAEAFVLGYTGRKSMLDELKGVVVELAAASYNLLGLEGAASHAEGGVSATVDLLPKQMKAQLDMYRIAKVG